MTQFPGYASPNLPPANPRPTSVTVLAIIGIIVGALGLLCNGFGIFGFLMLPKLAQMGTGPGGQPDPALQEVVKQLESIMPILIALAVVKMLAAIVAIAGGIGSLSLKPWGRTALLGYSIALIVLTIADLVVSLTMMPDMQGQQQPGQQVGSMAGGICGSIFWMAYPICVLIFMNKPHVKAAFRGETTGGMGGPGGVYPPQGGGYAPPPPPPSGPYAQ